LEQTKRSLCEHEYLYAGHSIFTRMVISCLFATHMIITCPGRGRSRGSWFQVQYNSST
jgi:hypothetical protein